MKAILMAMMLSMATNVHATRWPKGFDETKQLAVEAFTGKTVCQLTRDYTQWQNVEVICDGKIVIEEDLAKNIMKGDERFNLYLTIAVQQGYKILFQSENQVQLSRI